MVLGWLGFSAASDAKSPLETSDCVAASEHDYQGIEAPSPELMEAVERCRLAAPADDATMDAADASVSRSLEVVEELRVVLRSRAEMGSLPPYRLVDGTEIQAEQSLMMSEDRIGAFLVKCLNDVDAAADAVLRTLEWRRKVFPSVVSSEPGGRAAQLLAEGLHIHYLGPNRDGDLVMGMHCRWGRLLCEETPLRDVVGMLLLAAEEIITTADQSGHPQIVVIAFGGPVPYPLARVASLVFEAHYPERLKRAVVYPVPPAYVYVADTCLFFVPRRTRDKVSLISYEDDVVEAACLTSAEQLPEDWRGGIHAVTERCQPDTSLLTSLVLEFFNPFASVSEANEVAGELFLT
eukprot:TRINITY_DN69887_c0_g1_i1.p1 TRINITY_DN69887_c0_g1~~TRINITY_DN69887_c0_g1_i1.p1  ORF type:complete len:350 (+),score=61.76 TRINITY_DN69887_c0_g1_i1:89-1138(+)